jgi:hypothetical protein
MKKLDNFIDLNFNKIVLFLLIVIFVQTCGDGGNKKLIRRIETLSSKIDSLQNISVTKKDLQIEGLKSEKRMIQSTDRKILDVNRQSQIDEELKRIENK